MATHSSILAWKIPWTEEPGGLQSMGLQRVTCDLGTNTYTNLCLTPYTNNNSRWVVEVNLKCGNTKYLEQ